MVFEQKPKEQMLADMDAAAKIAEEELKNISKESLEPVVGWIRKYYGKAGYKRLCRILLRYG